MDPNKVVKIEDQTKDLVKVEITEQNPSVLICVYGTLRTGQGNWSWCLKDKAEYLGTFKSEPKFTMYGKHSGFPSLVPSGNTSIEYEVFKVTNKDVLKSLHGLEGCNGISGHPSNRFYDIQPMSTPVGEGWIYVRHNYDGGENSIITSGNWLKRNT